MKGGINVCNRNKLNDILSKVAAQAQTVFGSRLEQVILYGSYARGDFDDESDIDIMILADVDRNTLHQFKPSFLQLTSDLGMENDVLITVTLKDSETFHQYLKAVPFYQSVAKEGVPVAV